jgi:hypothetical protein
VSGSGAGSGVAVVAAGSSGVADCQPGYTVEEPFQRSRNDMGLVKASQKSSEIHVGRDGEGRVAVVVKGKGLLVVTCNPPRMADRARSIGERARAGVSGPEGSVWRCLACHDRCSPPAAAFPTL